MALLTYENPTVTACKQQALTVSYALTGYFYSFCLKPTKILHEVTTKNRNSWCWFFSERYPSVLNPLVPSYVCCCSSFEHSFMILIYYICYMLSDSIIFLFFTERHQLCLKQDSKFVVLSLFIVLTILSTWQ